MPAFSKLAVVAPCLALAAQSSVKSAFLAAQSPKDPGFHLDRLLPVQKTEKAARPIMTMAKSKDPNWDEKTVQQDYPHPDGAKYHADYPKDDRPNVTDANVPWTHVTVPMPSSGPAKYSAEYYRTECKKINDHCLLIRDHRLESTKNDLEYLENEYLRLKRIHDDMVQSHADQKADVKVLKEQIEEAKMIVADLAHCPPELAEAKAELTELEAIEDKTPNDIQKECDVEKVIIEKERCVAKLRDAEDLLASHRALLPGEQKEIVKALQPIPRQKERVDEAYARWQEVLKRGIDPSTHALELGCRRERDELMSGLWSDVGRLYQIYMAERAKREGLEAKHAEEEKEVDAQEKDVAAAKAEVDKAEVTVKKFAHCPRDLRDAEARLASLEAIKDKTASDVDEECEVEKEILRARACVEELRAAEKVLAHHEGIHATEDTELSGEMDEAAHAASFVPPQADTTATAKARWLAAKALYESSKCVLHDSLEK